jgi:hypothetical protein
LCLPALARGRSIVRAETTGVRHYLGDSVLARALTTVARATRGSAGGIDGCEPEPIDGKVPLR